MSCSLNNGGTDTLREDFCKIVELCEDTIVLCRSEYGDILEFFNGSYIPTGDHGVLPTAETAEADHANPPTLRSVAHTELIESVWNKASDGLKIYNSGDPETAYVTRTDPLTDAEKYGYTRIERPDDMNLAEVMALFAAEGIVPTLEYRTNPAPSGDVFAISYAGVSDPDVFYVNPSVGVKLYVSSKKIASTETDTTKNNIVYLTYDDGPTASHTTQLLDILDSYGVKATFFLTGEAILKYSDSAEEIALRGHGFGCHSVSHNYKKIYASAESLERELVEWESIVDSVGITLPHRMFRYPGGSVGSYFTPYEEKQMSAMIEDHGYLIFDWNVVTNDALLYMREDGENTYDYIKENFISTLETALAENEGKEGAPIIILMHETVEETVNLTPWLIEYLVNRGFTFGELADMGASWTFAEN